MLLRGRASRPLLVLVVVEVVRSGGRPLKAAMWLLLKKGSGDSEVKMGSEG